MFFNTILSSHFKSSRGSTAGKTAQVSQPGSSTPPLGSSTPPAASWTALPFYGVTSRLQSTSVYARRLPGSTIYDRTKDKTKQTAPLPLPRRQNDARHQKIWPQSIRLAQKIKPTTHELNKNTTKVFLNRRHTYTKPVIGAFSNYFTHVYSSLMWGCCHL